MEQPLQTACGNTSQQAYGIALGYNAGNNSQGPYAVSIGYNTGSTSQGANTIAIGNSCCAGNQGDNAIALGYYAASQNQGTSAIAIGSTAGQTSQGVNAIAIGAGAGAANQAAGSIVINATGSALNNTTVGSCVIAPIRNVNGTSGSYLFYNSVTAELTWGTETPSSIRYKENVTDISNEHIEQVLQLQPVEFDFNENTVHPGKHSFGLIAENVDTILPQIVSRNSSTGNIESVEYTQLIAPLLKLVQQHEKRLRVYESILIKNGLMSVDV